LRCINGYGQPGKRANWDKFQTVVGWGKKRPPVGVASEKGAMTLKLPADIASAGPMPLYLKMARLQNDNDLPVFPFITSPIEGA
jgi:hypothetical protein